MKKEMHKPLAFGIVMIICFSVLLSVGAFFVINSEKDETSFQKEPSFNIDSILNSDLPPAQKEMMIKYSVYNHVDESGKKIKIFSDEQSKEFKKRKRKGERLYLTYDDVLFLINDTIRIYNTYDEVVLTDLTDHTTPLNIKLSESGDQTIKTYHGDFSEFNKYRSNEEYYKMQQNILEILNYRISVLTTEYLTARIVDKATYNFFWYQLTFDDDYLPEKTVRYDRILLIEKDGETLSLEEKKEQIEKKANNLDPFISSPYVEKDENEERFCIFQLVTNVDLRSDISFEISENGQVINPEVVTPDDLIYNSKFYLYNGSKVALGDQRASPKRWATLCFPTEELSAKYPSWELKPSYFDTEKMTVSLVKGRKTFFKTEITDKDEIASLLDLIDREAVVNSNSGISPLYIPTNEYSYKINFMNGMTIYLPASPKFENYVAMIQTPVGNEKFQDPNTNFDYKMTKAFCEKIREMFSSELAEQLNNDPDYQSIPPYLLEKFENIPSEYYISFYSLIAEYTNDIKSKWSYSDNYKLLFDSTQTLTRLTSTHTTYVLLLLHSSYGNFEDTEFFIRRLANENGELKAWCKANDTDLYNDIKQELSNNFEKYFR